MKRKQKNSKPDVIMRKSKFKRSLLMNSSGRLKTHINVMMMDLNRW